MCCKAAICFLEAPDGICAFVCCRAQQDSGSPSCYTALHCLGIGNKGTEAILNPLIAKSNTYKMHLRGKHINHFKGSFNTEWNHSCKVCPLVLHIFLPCSTKEKQALNTDRMKQQTGRQAVGSGYAVPHWNWTLLGYRGSLHNSGLSPVSSALLRPNSFTRKCPHKADPPPPWNSTRKGRISITFNAPVGKDNRTQDVCPSSSRQFCWIVTLNFPGYTEHQKEVP